MQEVGISVLPCSMSQNLNIESQFFIVAVFTLSKEEIIFNELRPRQKFALMKLTEHLYPTVLS